MPDKNRIEEYYNKFQVLPQEAKTGLWNLYNIYKEAKEIDSSMGWETDDSVCEEASYNLAKAEDNLSKALAGYIGGFSWLEESCIIKRIFEERSV